MPTANPSHAPISIRKAAKADAPALVTILEGIAAERVHSAIDVPWTDEKERKYLGSLSAREGVHLAETAPGNVVGFQVLDLWAPTLSSMRHVAQLGTFLLPEWRRQGIGRELFSTTAASPEKPRIRSLLSRYARRIYRRRRFISDWDSVRVDV